jgi:signal transduction histidine kinase
MKSVGTESDAPARAGGPFRLVKYFIISGFAVIAIVTVALGAFLYARSVDTLLRGAENYGRLLAENLNYNIYNGFYAPLKARGAAMDLQNWDQFGALDSLVKDITYGLKIRRITVIDRTGKIVYSTAYDLIGTFEQRPSPFDQAVNGKDGTFIHQDGGSAMLWSRTWFADTYYPLREMTGNYWMLGNIYGVIQITEDVTRQYVTVQQYIIVIIMVAAGLMGFLFVALTLIVRRGENILLERANEQKRLEEQLQRSERLASIGQMVATIAHEIRNPLGIIRSSADVLVRKSDSEPQKIAKLSGIIVEEATRLSAILTDFLDFARPKPPALRVINVRDVVGRVRNNLDQESRARGIEWREDLPEGMIPLIAGDPDQLYQAFLNVAINAFDAMKNGGTLAVRFSEVDSRISIDFTDTGPGIREEDLPKIFTPFFTTHQMGTGLGLSVVHNIVSSHGGEVTASSEEGRGAVFSFFLQRGHGTETNEADAKGV